MFSNTISKSTNRAIAPSNPSEKNTLTFSSPISLPLFSFWGLIRTAIEQRFFRCHVIIIHIFFTYLLDKWEVFRPFTRDYLFICSITSSGFTVISTQDGEKPLLIAFFTERIFDHAQQ